MVKVAEKTGHIMKPLRKEKMFSYALKAVVLIARLVLAYLVGTVLNAIVNRLRRRRNKNVVILEA